MADRHVPCRDEGSCASATAEGRVEITQKLMVSMLGLYYVICYVVVIGVFIIMALGLQLTIIFVID